MNNEGGIMKMNCSRSIGAAQLFIIHYSLFIMNFVLDLYGHGSFHGGGEVLRREEGAFGGTDAQRGLPIVDRPPWLVAPTRG